MFKAAVLAVLSCTLCSLGSAQTTAPSGVEAPVAPTSEAARAFARARALYDIPADRGLKSFACDVSVDWKTLAERIGGKPVSPDDPQLHALQAVHLRTVDSLSGQGSLLWEAPAGAPEASPAMSQVRNGMQQMFTGFYQQWNLFENGYMVSVTDTHTSVEREGTGFRVFSGEGEALAEEHYDSKLVLLNFHAKAPQLELLETPTFADTPQGRRVTNIKAEIHQPPSGPAITSTIAIHYGPAAGGFQLPSTLTFNVLSAGTFEFHLSNCVANSTATPSASAH